MHITFRQGIVKSVPNFLQFTGNAVSIVIVQPSYVIATIADGLSNYLFAEKESVPNAWAGPFVPGTEYWLYWDLHSHTGLRTYGVTTLAPVESASPPFQPLNDQHWFDTVAMRMKVWNTTANRWINKIRVFAAKINTGLSFVSMSINSPSMEGTQVGSIPATPVAAGYLVFDTVGKAIHKSDGTFFTTEDEGITGITTASHVRLGSIVREAIVTTSVARNTIVAFTDFDQVTPAEPDTLYLSPVIGLVEADTAYNKYANVVTEGVISSLDWDWSAFGVNTPLYVGEHGVLTTLPVPPALFPVATIIGRNSIQLGSPRSTVSITYAGTGEGPMTTTAAGLARLSVDAVAPTDPVVVGDNDPRLLNIDNKVAKAGDTMTGFLTLNADPTTDMQAATKHYVDTQPHIATFVVTNDLEVVPLGGVGWFPPKVGQIISVVAMVSTPPTGSDIVLDIRKNGISILETQVLSIADSNMQGISVMLDVPINITTTDFITVDILQVGSTTPGSDLTVRVTYK